MNDILFAFLLTLLAGLSTSIGGAIGVLAKQTNFKFLAMCLSFSAGVMLFISFVEIFDKAKESLSYEYGYDSGFLFTTIAFFAGVLLIALIDKFIPHYDDETEHGDAASLKRTGISSAIAIAIHNFPEGLVTFMAAMYDPALGVAIAIAIALHNIPEGIAVSAPIYYATGSKKKAVLLATASGLTEPLGALAGFFLLSQIFGEAMFGITFAAVGGMMVFIALHQLLPAANKYGNHHLVMKGCFAGMVVIALSLLVLH